MLNHQCNYSITRFLNYQIAAALLALAASSACGRAPRFSALVDEYLDQFARRHPSIAAGNGIHTHDGALEDFSAGAIASEVDWLRAFRRRLGGIDASRLTPDERVDHRILQGIVDGWLLDLDVVRTWTRNPMIYGGYFLGKMAAMKLRRDYAAARGSNFNLREFHERVMTNGIAPWWAHRQLLLPGKDQPVIE